MPNVDYSTLVGITYQPSLVLNVNILKNMIKYIKLWILCVH